MNTENPHAMDRSPLVDGPEGAAPAQEPLALQAHEPHLVAYARRILGDLELARDVAQDTLLRFCQHRPVLEEGELSLRAWLLKTCRHRALDVRRKGQRMTPLPPDQMVQQAGVTAEDSSRGAERGEAREFLVRSVQELPELQREAVFLKFQHDLTYKEISEVMGKSVSHVGVLLHQALKALRQKAQRVEIGGFPS